MITVAPRPPARVAAAAALLAIAFVIRLWWSRRRHVRDARVPVTLLTGFLGSGKTTLFNHILSAAHGKRIAIIQNEFGDVGIDDRLMAKHTKLAEEEEIVEVLNGCVCCTVRGDLSTALVHCKFSTNSITTHHYFQGPEMLAWSCFLIRS